ncbi:GFA family protein [Methylopila henanensis]|uniref:GFA family protein n=1 Tax=Methylopila henanensis TaxID=873516 RepID=A0ABW4K2Y7_9HYPH
MAEPGGRSGGCLCGAARFTARPLALEIDACHCGNCRKWSGGVFLGVPSCDVAFEDDAAVAAYASSEYGERVFCKTCGSSLMWRMQDRSATAVALQAFDDTDGFVFAEEIFIDAKPSLYAFSNDTRKLTGPEFFARWAAAQEQAGG